MKKILENKKLLFILLIVVLLVFLIVIYLNSVSVGYVTIDINNESIVLGYNKKDIINNSKGVKNISDIKNKKITDGIDKILSEYKNGTIILIGLEDTETGKKVEKYFINDFKGIDRHILKFIYLDKNKTGKETLLNKMNLDVKSNSDKTISELIEYSKKNNVDTKDYLKDLDKLDGYKTRD